MIFGVVLERISGSSSFRQAHTLPKVSNVLYRFVLYGYHPEVPSSRDSQGHSIRQVPLVYLGLFETIWRQQGRLREERMERSGRVNCQVSDLLPELRCMFGGLVGVESVHAGEILRLAIRLRRSYPRRPGS